MKVLIFIALMLPAVSQAECKFFWIDHDYNTSTPAIRQQVCDNTYDPPSINTPSIQPIQRPQIRPIETPTIPPIGTTRCRNASVYNESTRRWETQRVCD